MKDRVTISLPPEIVEEIDRREGNRSRFILHAVRAELDRLRRAELTRSLESPNPESEALSDEGFENWVLSGSAEDASLLDPADGKAVRWVSGEGWTEEDP